MAMTINTNTASLIAQSNLSRSKAALDISLQRLSSGQRINSARDDAAGLGIATRLSAEIGGLNMARRNANDVVSLAQTAEGALQESTHLLQRMRDLAVQSASDTNSYEDRAKIQKEIVQLQGELTRIADMTRFGGKKLLDGSFQSQVFQIGAYAGENISLSIPSAKANAIGDYSFSSSTDASSLGAVTAAGSSKMNNNFAAQTLSVSGTSAYSQTFRAGTSAYDIAAVFESQSATTGVHAKATSTAQLTNLRADGAVNFNLYGENATAVAISAQVTTDNLTNLRDAINAVSAQTGIIAEGTGDNLTLKNNKGYDIAIENFSVDKTGNQSIDLVGGARKTTLTEGGRNDSATVGGVVTFSAFEAYTIESSARRTFQANSIESSNLQAVSTIDISTQAGANTALATVDSALNAINDIRSSLGAVQNSMTSTMSNLENIANNAKAARSQIMDTDFALETANVTRGQILQQAGTAILAQANAMPQTALQLLS